MLTRRQKVSSLARTVTIRTIAKRLTITNRHSMLAAETFCRRVNFLQYLCGISRSRLSSPSVTGSGNRASKWPYSRCIWPASRYAGSRISPRCCQLPLSTRVDVDHGNCQVDLADLQGTSPKHSKARRSPTRNGFQGSGLADEPLVKTPCRQKRAFF
jgi:hypothetical protein